MAGEKFFRVRKQQVQKCRKFCSSLKLKKILKIVFQVFKNELDLNNSIDFQMLKNFSCRENCSDLVIVRYKLCDFQHEYFSIL